MSSTTPSRTTRTTFKLGPGKYLHMPTQNIVQNVAHGDWRLLRADGSEIGQFTSKSAALNILNRGDKRPIRNGGNATTGDDETRPIPTQTSRPPGVRPTDAERQGAPENTPPGMSRLDYLTRVAATIVPPPPGKMYVVLEIPDE